MNIVGFSRKGLGRTSWLAAFGTTAALYAVAAIYTLAVLVTVFHNTNILDRDHIFYTTTLDDIGTAVLTITVSTSTASRRYCAVLTPSQHPLLDPALERRRMVARVGALGAQQGPLRRVAHAAHDHPQ